jgi:hypothetical protein
METPFPPKLQNFTPRGKKDQILKIEIFYGSREIN